MASFDANMLPITVPTLASTATAADIATFNANFVKNIVDTGNSLLASYIDLKETDFYSVGELPDIWQQWFASDPANWQRFNERPDTNRPAISYADIDNALDQLNALAPPAEPTLSVISADPANLEVSPPTVVLPDQPDTTLPDAPTGEPTVVDPAMPSAPTYTLPDVPMFEDLQLPAAPALSVPSFDEVAPVFNLAPYTGQFSYVDPGYTSELRDELVFKLLNDLRYGSYGIEPADEAALWFRARDRAAGIARRETQEIMRRAAATSFPMPQGALYDALEQAEQRVTNDLAENNRDIALKRADMYVEGRKFTFAQVQQYERMEQDLYNATQERALNYAKSVIEMGILVYRASIDQFNAQLQAYATKSNVFESRVRAELAKAQIYKTQIEAESVRVDFNRAKIEQYLAQLKAVDTVVDLYKSELQAVTIQMQVQQQKIDIFRAQLQAYSEKLRAKEAEYNIYLAATRGELAKVDVYKAQIDAYNATLSGTEMQARIKLQSNESLLQQYRTATAAYASKLEAVKRLIDGRLEEARLKGVIYTHDIEAYRALTQSTAAAQGSLLDWGRLQQNYLVEQNKSAQENVRFKLKQLEDSVNLQANVNRNGIDFIRAALAGATSGLNSLGVKTEEG